MSINELELYRNALILLHLNFSLKWYFWLFRQAERKISRRVGNLLPTHFNVFSGSLKTQTKNRNAVGWACYPTKRSDRSGVK